MTSIYSSSKYRIVILVDERQKVGLRSHVCRAAVSTSFAALYFCVFYPTKLSVAPEILVTMQ